MVPPIAALLLQMKDLEPGRFPHLRYITNAAAALPPAHIERLQALFPTTRIFSMYGQTECTRVCYLPPEQLTVRPASVGKAIPNTEAYIVNEHDERVMPGEVGELVVRGSHIMQGYWEQPEETAKAIYGGYFHSGDLGVWDEFGNVNIVDRKKDVIISGGENISSPEVEAALYLHPAVLECAVIGVPSEKWGETPKALIVLREGQTATEEEIIAFSREHLAHFRCPTSVDFVETLPRTVTGKLQKFLIREAYWKGVERRVN